ncbi:MAG: hypothetical protein IJY84_05295 [Clostridia bacterium]|nr:hypothetical protein [Clostridia bacterium]
MDDKKVIDIILIVCIVFTVIGGILMGLGETKTEYPTSEYWVAKDYAHVYENYSGRIADVIEDDETCEIKGDTIIVIKRNQVLWGIGLAIAAIFGMGVIGIIFQVLRDINAISC